MVGKWLPQLDVVTYTSATSSVVFCFLSLVFILYNYIVPQLAQMLKTRSLIMNEQKEEDIIQSVVLDKNTIILEIIKAIHAQEYKRIIVQKNNIYDNHSQVEGNRDIQVLILADEDFYKSYQWEYKHRMFFLSACFNLNRIHHMICATLEINNLSDMEAETAYKNLVMGVMSFLQFTDRSLMSNRVLYENNPLNDNININTDIHIRLALFKQAFEGMTNLQDMQFYKKPHLATIVDYYNKCKNINNINSIKLRKKMYLILDRVLMKPDCDAFKEADKKKDMSFNAKHK